MWHSPSTTLPPPPPLPIPQDRDPNKNTTTGATKQEQLESPLAPLHVPVQRNEMKESWKDWFEEMLQSM